MSAFIKWLLKENGDPRQTASTALWESHNWPYLIGNFRKEGVGLLQNGYFSKVLPLYQAVDFTAARIELPYCFEEHFVRKYKQGLRETKIKTATHELIDPFLRRYRFEQEFSSYPDMYDRIDQGNSKLISVNKKEYNGYLPKNYQGLKHNPKIQA